MKDSTAKTKHMIATKFSNANLVQNGFDQLLRDGQIMCDVTISVVRIKPHFKLLQLKDGKSLQAHNIVLSMVSLWFKEAFSKTSPHISINKFNEVEDAYEQKKLLSYILGSSKRYWHISTLELQE